MEIEPKVLESINEIIVEASKISFNENETSEIEVRFGKFNDKFNPQINLKTFEESIKFLNTFAKLEKIEYSMIEYFGNYKKYTIMEKPENCIFSFKQTFNVFYIEKHNVKNIDIKDYNIRFSYNKEIYKTHITENKKASLYANRKRFTYKYNGLTFDISMFIRDNKPITSEYQTDIQFDLEIEMEKNGGGNLQLLLDMTYQFLKIIDETKVVLKQTIKDQIKNVYYFNLTRSKKFVGSQPQTISSEKINSEYAITLKLNGKRAFLMNIGDEFFEISTKMDIKYTELVSKNKLKEISIIDTEYFQGVYHVFDILFYEGQDVRQQLFKTRMELIEKLIEKINHENIVKKEYIFGDIQENTIKYYKKYFSKKNENLDGFIYLPVNTDYFGVTLKWKPDYYNTIDFKIKKIGNLSWELLCYTNEMKGTNEINEIPFYTTEYKNLGITTVTQDQENFYTNSSVVEFIFSQEEEKFIPIKTRYDKLKGNYIDVAQDNFASIMNPFTFDEFKQQKVKELTLFNSRRFNNYIKRRLLMDNSKNAYTLLDLACGKGGDMFKWVDANITFVKGYDNDTDSIKEANNRYNSNIKDENTTKNYHFTFEYADLSYEVVNPQLKQFTNSFGGNYSGDGKFDIATCFFAIHYFFKNEQSLNIFIGNITENLKQNGTFIMTTFDEELLLKEGDIDTPLLKVHGVNKVNGVNENYGRAIDVWIKDTVLDKEREEYIVNFEFLVYKLKQQGIELIKTGTFEEFYPEWKTKKNYLNDIEKKLSYLNRYAVFKYTGKINKIQEEPTVFKFDDFNQEINEIEEMEIDQVTYKKQELQKKKMAELKDILINMKLNTIGKKEILINRILGK